MAKLNFYKYHGDLEGVYINGVPQGITFHEHDEFTLYPASIISVNKNRFTKHYFIGSQRVASRIGSGRFNNVYGRNGSYVTAGQQDYAERMSQIESQKEEYYKELGIAPGVPTMKGAYGDPENTGVGYNTIITELGDHSVPKNWEQFVVKRGKGETPGPPIIWSEPQDPEDAQPGYGYIADDTNEEETFFYHSDHLGSTSYITDDKGNITQYDAYLPYGELLVDEHSSSEEMPYKFNGKELDEETGLYYYGARYMPPVASIWYGVDPLMEKYPNMGSYVYCHGNPMNRIDPDGMDDYKLSKDGHLEFWRKTNAKTTHRIFSGKSNITVNKNLVNQLVENQSSDGTDARIFNADDAFKFFKFAADNSNVEWNLIGIRNKSTNLYLVGTNYSNEYVSRNNNESTYKNMLFHLHSHPWGSNYTDGACASGKYSEYKNVAINQRVSKHYQKGDIWILNNMYNAFKQEHPSTPFNDYPKAYIYYSGDTKQHPQLFQYDLERAKFNTWYNPTYEQVRRKVDKR